METDILLGASVRDPERNLLLPAGTWLTDTVMADLAQRGRARQFPVARFADHATLLRDTLALCQQPPYHHVFDEPLRLQALTETFQRLTCPLPLLEIIADFKGYEPYTYRHMLIVYALSLLLAQELFTDRHSLEQEAMAAPTHDFGKLNVPLPVLIKDEDIDAAEQRQLQHHAAAGYALLSYYLGDPRHPAALIARDHHERRDGSGYPRGIRQDNRVVEVVLVCDIFDALVAARPYRPTAYDVRTALEEITVLAERGEVQTDVVRALVACLRQEHPGFQQVELSHERRGQTPTGNHYRGVRSTKKD